MNSLMGDRIKILRLKANLTQEELALKLGLKGKSSIANYESSKITPSDDIKLKICEIFNCSMDYLMGLTFDVETFICQKQRKEELMEEAEKISLLKLDSDMRYISHKESILQSTIRNKTTEEYQRLLYIELPNLINKIVNTRAVPMPVIPELVQIAIDEIKKITTTECNSMVEKYKSYINKSPDGVISNDLKN